MQKSDTDTSRASNFDLRVKILAAALALKIEFITNFKCTYYPHVEQWLRRSSRDNQS